MLTDKYLQDKLEENFNLFFPKHTETTQSRDLSVKTANKTQVVRDKLNTCGLIANHYIIGE